MRRHVSSLLALGLMGLAAGCCHHTAGVCDCACTGDTCCYGHGPGSPIDIYNAAPSAPVISGAPVMNGAPVVGSAPVMNGAPVINGAPVPSGPVARPEVIQILPQNANGAPKA